MYRDKLDLIEIHCRIMNTTYNSISFFSYIYYLYLIYFYLISILIFSHIIFIDLRLTSTILQKKLG